MITCAKCSKDNQDHYKFCLGCGSELPRGAAAKPFSVTTPPHGVKAASAPAQPAATPAAPAPTTVPVAAASAPAQPAAAPVAAASAPAQPVAAPVASGAPAPSGVCPQCGHTNAATNLFCGSCGFRLPGAAAPARPPAAATAPRVGAVALTALRADGTEAGSYSLPGASATVGRETGGIFAGDSYLSPRHATLTLTAGRLTVTDAGSLNGVYKKLVRDVPVELRPNDVFRIGQEIIKFEALTSTPVAPGDVERLGSPSKGYVGRIALVIGRDVTGNAFPIPESGVHLGRERGDVLFPEDGYVSGLHCRLSWESGRLMLTDLGSSNGTFLRLREEAEVQSGDVLLMGQQLFRVAVG